MQRQNTEAAPNSLERFLSPPAQRCDDLIATTLNQSATGTLVERSSRYIMPVHLQHDYTAETVRDGRTRRIPHRHRHGRFLLRASKPMAARQHRDQQPSATPCSRKGTELSV